jgi:hypothetical protein
VEDVIRYPIDFPIRDKVEDLTAIRVSRDNPNLTINLLSPMMPSVSCEEIKMSKEITSIQRKPLSFFQRL